MSQLQHQMPVEAHVVLDQLTETTAQLVAGAQYAGITAISGRTDVRTTSATGLYPVVLDDLQRQYGEGPGLAVARDHQRLRVEDLGADERWPRYRSQAVQQTPVRSIMSFRLIAQRHSAAVLNVYADRVDAFDDASLEWGTAAAHYTALAWGMLRRDEQFRSALASRDVIGQAKGMLMERFAIDAPAAFELLKRLSQESNTPLAEIAHRVVDSSRPAREPVRPDTSTRATRPVRTFG
ncbi:GAF and ANTAR domain-containing protein [Mycobacterium marseillense]|uniref:GAF and ANTAR domain-containing protein n=1 Tax=Mycobacterium marseillense TaxID=701042 RepID=UPI001F4F3FE3|nr:GAF and ANTAR domain-containing protein [Mycobacterium marseillense]